MKTTLEYLQEKEAKKKGYYSWRELVQNQNSGYVSGLMEVLAERYANAKLQEAEDKIEEKMLDVNSDYLVEGSINIGLRKASNIVSSLQIKQQ